MAERELAIIVRARDLASKTIGKVKGGLTSLGRAGSHAVNGLTTAMTRLAAATAVGLVGALALGVRSLGHLERVTNATNAVIESTGGAAGQTAKSIREHAEALEKLTTADDKAIQEGQNLLLTFTKIGGKTFPRATKAAVNMAIAMAKGDVANADFKGSALQVGKALNDPIKGMTALTRAGVSFTKEQKERVKRLVEAGRVTEAQTLILKELETEFGNAGKAAGTGFEADMRRVADAGEDVTQALARGVMPALGRFASFLSTKLADPKVQAAIEEIGDDLGKAAESAVKFIEKIDWDAVGAGLASARDAAKTVVGMFTSLPPWVQTAIVTGWGLNKLSGGAVSGIVTELGKGLIKGVLGMTAGVVNVKAGVVNGAGGVPGVPGGGKAGILSFLGPLGILAAAAEATKGEFNAQTGANMKNPFEGGIGGGILTGIHNLQEVHKLYGEKEIAAIRAAAQGESRNSLQQEKQQRHAVEATRENARRIAEASLREQRIGERTVLSQAQTKAAVDASKARLAAEQAATRRETTRGLNATAAAARSAAAAIRAKKLSVVVRTVNNLRLTVRDTQQKLTFQQNAALYG